MKERLMKNKHIARAVTTITAIYLGNMSIYCDNAFDKAETGLGNLLTRLWGVGKKLLPVGIAVCVLALFITHDEKKLATWKTILVAMCVGYILLWFVANDGGSSLIDTLQELVGG